MVTLDTRASDADLIARSLAEPDLFTAVFDRHSAEILRYVYARLGPELAEDVTAAAATAAAALVLTSGPGAVPGQHGTAGHTRSVVTAAWTVREDADGTVTIYLQQYANPAGMQQTLQADGINAIVRQIPAVLRTVGNQMMPFPTCNYDTLTDAAPQAVQSAVWAGIGTLKPTVLNNDTMPACVPNHKVPPPGGVPLQQES